MGHSRSDIYSRFYTNSTICTDSQSAFIGTPAKDWVIQLSSHMSRNRDPAAPKVIKAPSVLEVSSDPSVTALLKETAMLKKQILATYQSIQAANGTALGEEYKWTQLHVRNARKRVKKRLEKQRRKEYFRNRGTLEIQRQNEKLCFDTNTTTAALSTARTELAALLCRSEDTAVKSWHELQSERIAAMAKLMSHCSTRNRRTHHKIQLQCGSQESQPPAARNGEDLYLQRQCVFCYFDVRLSCEAQDFRYAKKDSLLQHIETNHMCGNLLCPFPACQCTPVLHWQDRAALAELSDQSIDAATSEVFNYLCSAILSVEQQLQKKPLHQSPVASTMRRLACNTNHQLNGSWIHEP